MRNRLSHLATCLALLASAASRQETRVIPDGHEPPPASLYQMGWLVGQWTGVGIDGAPALESWLPPAGDTMVGTFVQQTADGGIRFTEHLYLMEEEGTLVLRLKHFNADLTGWEDKAGMVTFRLVAIEHCAAYFGGLTLRCDGEDGLLAAVRMKSDKPEPQELVFRFGRATPPSSRGPGCPDAQNTIELDACLGEALSKAEEQLATYLEAVVDTLRDQPDLIAQVRESEDAFDAYRDAECGAVWENWRDGTARSQMRLTCRIELTHGRTMTLWENWLALPSSDPPLPGPTR